MIWTLHVRPKNLILILGYSFAPALSCLLSGQITLFLLLGLTLFLRLHGTRPFLAGVSLWFCMLKPHLFVPFGIALIAWMIAKRAYQILLGTITATSFSSAITYVIDPGIWGHYAQMMREVRIDRISIPCFSMVLRDHVPPRYAWLQYLPLALGSLWALLYYRRHRADWDWLEHGSLLMFVSVLVAPYTWFMDQCVLIPALLHGAYVARSRSLIALLALGSAFIEIEILRGVPLLRSMVFLWTTPAWLLWYLVATRWQRRLDRLPTSEAPLTAAV